MNFTRIAYIYGLADSAVPNELRYVGKAISPRQRLAMHIVPSARKREGTHKTRWMNSVLLAGRQIVMKILMIVPIEHWEAAERDCIARCGRIFRLTNGNSGGLGAIPKDWVRAKMKRSWSRTPEALAEMSRVAKTLWANPSYRERTTASHIGKKQSPELVAKRIRVQFGRVHSAEEKAKRRASIIISHGVSIKRTDTGEVFDSCAAAARAVGAPFGSSITTALRRGIPWRGIRFERVQTS